MALLLDGGARNKTTSEEDVDSDGIETLERRGEVCRKEEGDQPMETTTTKENEKSAPLDQSLNHVECETVLMLKSISG